MLSDLDRNETKSKCMKKSIKNVENNYMMENNVRAQFS